MVVVHKSFWMLTSELRDDQMAANSAAAHKFIEDMDLSMINHDRMQL